MDPSCMLKSPPGYAWTCWRVLELQTLSTNTSLGTAVPSSVATCPCRFATKSPTGWFGCVLNGPFVVGCPGFVVGGPVGGGGDGLGAGGFCASATGAIAPVAHARPMA